MAINTNKLGYSTAEVAQILNCTMQTVRKWINDGKLKANVGPVGSGTGGGRSIRIERSHIQDYLKANAGKYSPETLKAWGVQNTANPAPVVEAPKSQPEKKETKIQHIPIPPQYCTGSAYDVPDDWKKDLACPSVSSFPTGAWADLARKHLPKTYAMAEEERLKEQKLKEEQALLVTKPEPEYSYSVSVNGRIAVSGISKETAIAIFTALINDTGKGEFHDISVKKWRDKSNDAL